MIDEGHVIGNHTVTHPSAGLQSLSVEDQIKEIKDVHDYMLENYNYEMYLSDFQQAHSVNRVLQLSRALDIVPYSGALHIGTGLLMTSRM